MSKYAELKEKYKGKRLILHVASYLSPMKGTDYAVEAMGYVNKEFPDALLLIINSHNEFERQGELLSLAHDCGAKIQFVTMVKDEDMPGYYSLAEVLLAPNLDENVHLPELEAQSCGCPPIMFQGKMTNESVIHDKTGILVSRKDSELLGRMIVNLFMGIHPFTLKVMSKNCRPFILDNFTWDKCIEHYNRIISEVTR